MPIQPTLSLGSLDGTNGITINGIASGDNTGVSVSGGGDFNGDGFADIIIAAPAADPNGLSNAGTVYVVYGSATGIDPNIDLGALDGSNGFVVTGDAAGMQFGRNVRFVGDMNGDGFDDFIVGTPAADPNGATNAGQVHVIFGHGDNRGGVIASNSLDGSNGFVINGIAAGDVLGNSVAAAGDINGDGLADIIVGAPGADPFGVPSAGQAYVIFGQAAGQSAIFNLTSLNGDNGFALSNFELSQFFGDSVGGVGDFNGDGQDDVVVGAVGIRNPFSGSNAQVGGGFVYLLSSDDSFDSIEITGSQISTFLGDTVTGLGDINGDGFDDVAIAAPLLDGPFPTTNQGGIIILFGRADAGSERWFYDNGPPGSSYIYGENSGDQLGISIAAAGDMNDDGVDDFVVSANGANGGTGGVYVFFGGPDITDSFFYFYQGLGSNGFALDGINGFEITGIDQFDNVGFGVSAAGDINGDGYDDLLIGGNGGDPSGLTDAGEVYIVYGGPTPVAPATPGDDIIRGSSGADTINGLTGNDEIYGRDGDDVLFGGTGVDVLSGDNGNDRLTGGAGLDILVGGAGDDIYNLVDEFDAIIEMADEGIDIVRTALASYTLGANLENLVMLGEDAVTGIGNDLDNQITGTLADNVLFGGAGDDVLLGRTGNDILTGGDGDDMLDGGADNDTILGGEGVDILEGGSGDDLITGGRGSDVLSGGTGVDQIFGDHGSDSISGGAGDDALHGGIGYDTLNGDGGRDMLNGGAGRDVLNGGIGDDILIGGANRDVMTGGAGADRFVFALADFAGITGSTADLITDFVGADGDRIDLTAVDAIRGARDDAFTFIGDAAFSNTRGELRYRQAGNEATIVEGDTDGDGVADFAIRLDGLITLTAADFHL